MASKASKAKLTKAVKEAGDYRDKVKAQRDEIAGKIQKQQAETAGKRQHIGKAVVEGGNLEKLATDLAHQERELATMRQALVEVDQLLEDAEKAWAEARAEELKAFINECRQEALDEYEAAGTAFDEVEKHAVKALDLQKQARAAHTEMIPLVRQDAKQIYEMRVQGLKKPNSILMAAVNHYRGFKVVRS